MTKLQKQIKSNLADLEPEFNLPLASKTYFKIGGPAEVYFDLSERNHIIKLVTYCQKNGLRLTILSGGSNVVVADEGICGVVLSLSNNQVKKTGQKKDLTLVTAEAGIKTSLFVRKTLDLGLTGLEYFLGVPGKLGGAIYNNAHYLEDLIGEHISRVEVISEQGKPKWLSHQECQFGYDQSRFQTTQEVILSAEFQLEQGNPKQSQALIAKATEYRAKTQPLGEPSSGCIFQNTPNTPELKDKFPQYKDRQHIGGGFLIDQAGLKNTKIGGISVSDKHAAFFVNDGTGKAAEVKELVEVVKKRVKDKFGVELEEEVFYLK